MSHVTDQREWISVVQLTDCHLRKEPDGTLLGMNTRLSLDAVLDLIQKRQERPDIVLATGDLAQDGSAEAYRCFEEKTAIFACPVVWFSGNHDDPATMEATVTNAQALIKTTTCKAWKFIFLDSSVREKVYGELAPSELELLERELEKDQDKHVAVCFHHHPVEIASVWLDNIGLKNRDQLFQILDKYQHVRMILWGHIHQEYDQVRKGVRLLATPSTCIQFKPSSKDFALDSVAPGFRWLRLGPGGEIETEVVRAEDIVFDVDLSSKGY